MSKIDGTVKKETVYIAVWTVILSAVMESVFLIIAKWNITVLTGNLLGAAAAILNFFMMGITVQRSVKKDEIHAAATMRTSQTLRNLFLLVVAMLGIMLDCFNPWAAIIPLFFPRIAIAFRPLFNKKELKKNEK